MEDAIRSNMSELVELTNNVEDVVGHLVKKGALGQEEAEEITGKESNFDKKSQLYWTILYKKDEATTRELLEALKATGNDGAAAKLGVGSTVDAQVTVEPTPGVKTPDAEGIALADEIEKEFTRIQSEVESEASAIVDEIEGSIPAEVFGVNSEGSEVKVEVTQPEIEEKPEEIEEKSEIIEEKQEIMEEKPEILEEKPEIIEEKHEIIEEKPEIIEEKPEIIEPKASKQVSFEPKLEEKPKLEDEKEFVLNHEPQRPQSPEDEKVSIVALNREKFEKPGGPKVTYSFAKGKKDVGGDAKVGGGGVVAKGEEPPESTVKNLRNFWQKLGSVDKSEEGVEKRSGTGRNNFSQNRRTMI